MEKFILFMVIQIVTSRISSKISKRFGLDMAPKLYDRLCTPAVANEQQNGVGLVQVFAKMLCYTGESKILDEHFDV